MTAEEERDALARALRDVLQTLHPVYPSTAGPYGGIGGAAMTPWCHVIRPHTEEHTSLLQQAEDALRAAFHSAEREAMNRAALPPSPAEEAHGPGKCVSVEDANRVLAETRDAMTAAVRRAALASPAPAPQGEVQRAIPDALVPDVQALIERAEKRAVARALRDAADAVRHQLPGYIGRIDTADSLDDRAAALASPAPCSHDACDSVVPRKGSGRWG